MSDPCTPAAEFRTIAPRRDGWSPVHRMEFLEKLAETGLVSRAAREAGMSLSACYTLRRNPREEPFRVAWEAALLLARDRLADIWLERAIEGEEHVTIRNGDETRHRKTNYRLGLGWLNRMDARAPAFDAVFVSRHFDDWLDAIASVGGAPRFREIIAPWEGGNYKLREWARDFFPLPEDSADFESEPVWWDGQRFQTWFPPAEDFDGIEISEYGLPEYSRTLSTRELEIVVARNMREAAEWDDSHDADAGAAVRDAWFAEASAEADAPDEKEAPIEIKSMEGLKSSRIHSPHRLAMGRICVTPSSPSRFPDSHGRFRRIARSSAMAGSGRSGSPDPWSSRPIRPS